MATALMTALRSGAWLTRQRLRGYSVLLLALYALAIVVYVAISHGLNDFHGKPIGTDFSNVYAAGLLVREGKPGDAYDPHAQHAAEQRVFGPETPFFGWHYPPFFLMVAAALAALSYPSALLGWIALTLPAYLAVIHSILPRRETLLAAAAFPAVIVNIGHGQNGFLTAALLGGALMLLDRRPALAGVLIGLLAYKPQFGVLIPLVLLVTWRWRTIVAAMVTVVGLIIASWLALGGEVFKAFAGSAEFSRVVVLEAGGTGWEKIQSIFSAVRSFGGSVGLAYAAQGALLLGIAVSLTWLWRSRAAYELQAAALAIACLLATPYVLDYDLVVLAVAIAFLVRHGLAKGFGDYEISLLAAAFAMPLVTRMVMGATGVPVGLITLMALYALTLSRAASDLSSSKAPQAPFSDGKTIGLTSA